MSAFQAACKKRAFSNSKFALPYIWRLLNFRRLICPSVCPLLHSCVTDFGRRLPDLWGSDKLRVEHKKELLRSLISRVVLSRPEREKVEARIVWISGAVSTLSVRAHTQGARSRGLRGDGRGDPSPQR
jgi:hypothetical protein